MKPIIIATGLAIVLSLVVLTNVGTTEEVTKFVKGDTVVETVTVNDLEVRIKEALEANQASTTALAQKSYDEVYNKEVKRIEDKVKAEYIAEIEATISDAGY